MPEPDLRAADADRAAVASALGTHMADGRLTVDEYDERLARAYAARTYGELDQLTADLPGGHPRAEAVRREHPHPVSACGPGSWNRGGHDGSAWLRTALIVLTIWAITSIGSGAFLYFWPIWVIGPWGAILLARTLSGGNIRRQRSRTSA